MNRTGSGADAPARLPSGPDLLLTPANETLRGLLLGTGIGNDWWLALAW